MTFPKIVVPKDSNFTFSLIPLLFIGVFNSCLKAIRQLQKNGHIPSDASLFKSYAKYGHFVDVRVAALDALVDYTRGGLEIRSGSISVNIIATFEACYTVTVNRFPVSFLCY